MPLHLELPSRKDARFPFAALAAPDAANRLELPSRKDGRFLRRVSGVAGWGASEKTGCPLSHAHMWPRAATFRALPKDIRKLPRSNDADVGELRAGRAS
jgi:hypothetical protein